MIPRLVTGALLTAGLALAAGCGSADGSAPPAPGGAEPPAGSASLTWAGSVCEAIQAQATKLTSMPALNSTEPAEVRQAMLTYLDTISGAFGDLTGRIEKAGPPPVTGGGQLVEQTLRTLRETKQTLDGARAEAEQASPADPAAFRSTMNEVGRQVRKLQGMADPTGNLRAHPELEDAFAKAPACKRLEGK